MNYLILFIISVVAFGFGGFLYSPAGLGKIWEKEMGFKDEDISRKEGILAMLYSFLVILIEAVVFYVLKQYATDFFLVMSLGVGLIIILRESSNLLFFEGKSKVLLSINLLHGIIELLILVLGIQIFL